jgi:mitogen-activated protein kinase kinase
MDQGELSDLKINLERDYHINQIIGQGSYGSVLEVINKKNKMTFALKTVFYEEINPESLDIFLKEVKILSQINHRNIIALYGYQTLDNQIRILLERMDMSLDDYMRKVMKPNDEFSKQQIYRIFYSVLEGLNYMYEKYKIAHRDIKPGNILIDAKMEKIKLADFGCAKIIENQESNTQVLTLQVGTQVYMVSFSKILYLN